nr:protein translocase subunit SecD [Candidatus Levybacteria bacterium]
GLPFMNFFGRDLSLRKGLDLQGGTSITLQANMKDVAENQRDAALNSAKEVIERRINFLGVSEPVVQTSKAGNEYRILVEIPGITDVNQAVQLVGQTALLTFWEAGAPVATDSAETASESALTATEGKPLGVQQLLGPNAKQTELNGNDLKQANVVFDPSTGKPQVELQFTTEGADKFGDITERNVDKILAIALDDQLIQAPRVNEPIFGGSAVITGDYTTQQANTLQIQLNAGALPVSLTVLEQRAVGATLGQESVEKSLLAGIFGFIVIVIFMISLYGRLGIIASIALFIYSLILLTLFRLIPVTLTLAGIAGFILSVGIAVDANILIFERMKEELRRGRSHTAAVDLGFSRAWLSIRDSNVASLITSSVLFYFGTGVVRGFAFTLALGIIISIFSAIFVTKTLLQIFYKRD